jgi:FkbM family methyltransferase
MAFFRHLLKYPLANRPGQYLLRKQVKLCHWLMGVGAGGSVGDSGEIGVMKKFMQENRRKLVIFDVGANCGQFLNLAVSRLGNRIQEIHSFEPAAATFAALQQAKPNHPGVTLNHLALGAAPGKAELYYDAEKSGLASLTKRDLGFRNIEFERHETITLRTLDAYCAEKNIGHIDWLKLDVEGHELDVLRGGSVMFAKRAVDLVTFEFGGCNIDTRTFLRDFFQFFTAQGMTLYRITPGGYFSRLKRYRETEEQFVTINFVAMRSAANP